MIAASSERFEAEFADRLRVAPIVACRSGTDAFIGVLLAAGVVPGDEVILPVSICQTMVSAVFLIGCVPVLADCCDDLALSPNALDSLIGARTRAVVVHHPHGLAIDLAPYREKLGGLPILLIEDCAQSLGAARDGTPVGRAGDAAIFSFGATKTLAAGIGGAAVAPDREALREALRLGSPGARDDCAIGLRSELSAGEAEAMLAALAGFELALDARLANAEEILARSAFPAIGARPAPEHVYHRVVLAVPEGMFEALAEFRALWQTAVPVPPHRSIAVRRRYEAIGRSDLLERRFPGWDRVTARCLFVKTGPEVARASLRELARALEDRR